MNEKDAEILGKLHGCSCWLKRAQDKYRPYLENMPAEGNYALFQAIGRVEEAIKILLDRKEDGDDAAKRHDHS